MLLADERGHVDIARLPGLFLGDDTGVDLVLEHTLIMAELLDEVLPDTVNARITHIEDQCLAAGSQQHAGGCRANARQVDLVCFLAYGIVGRVERLFQKVHWGAAGQYIAGVVMVEQRFNGGLAGDIAAAHAAHAIRDHEQRPVFVLRRVGRGDVVFAEVFVAFAFQPDIGQRCHVESA